MSLIEKLLSEKGKPMVVHACYIYTQERTTTTKIIFRCQNRSCKGNQMIDLSDLIKATVFL